MEARASSLLAWASASSRPRLARWRRSSETNRGQQEAAWEQVGRAEKLIAGARPRGRRRSCCSGWRSRTRWPEGRGGARVRRCRDRVRGVARARRHPRERAQHEGDHISRTGRPAKPRGPATKRGDRPCLELRGRDALPRQSRQQPARPRALLPRRDETLEDAAAEAQRFGAMWYRDWLAPERVTYMYYDGAWDEALPQIADLVQRRSRPEALRASWSRAISPCAHSFGLREATWPERSKTRSARSIVARIAKNPQLLHPALAGLAALRAEIGDWKTPLAGRRALRELAGTSDSVVRLLADRGRLRTHPARARRRARRGARPDQGALAVGGGRARIRFRRVRPPQPTSSPGSGASRTRPTRVCGRALTRMCAARSSSTARSGDRPGTCCEGEALEWLARRPGRRPVSVREPALAV